MAELSKAPRLSIVVPVLNEEEAIPPFLARTIPILEAVCREQLSGAGYEFIFVDDGSTDRTAAVVVEAARNGAAIKLVRLSRRFGKEAALAAGLSHAEGDAVIPMDVDLQDPPEVIPRMVEAWKAGAEIVNGVRSRRREDTWLKRNTARLFYRLYNSASDVPIERNVGDFRLLDRVVIDALNALPEHARFTKGLYSWVGFNNANVEYERPARAHGTTKWSYRRLIHFALDGITASTTVPLRVWSIAGLAIALVAFVYAAFLVMRTVVWGIDVPGYASTMVAILFMGGLNLLSLGVMGEYVGRIAQQVRGRPLYVIRETYGMTGGGTASLPKQPKGEAAASRAR